MADINGKTYTGGYSGLTHADISSYLGRTLTTAEQTLCTALILQGELYFARATNRNYLTTSNYTETFNAGETLYYPANFTINEIQSISLDGTKVYEKGGSSNSYVLNTDFFVFDDCIKFETIPQSISDNRNALIIVYSIDNCFGSDAKLAIQLWVVDFFISRETGGKSMANFSAGGLAQTFLDNVPKYIEGIVHSYRKYNV